MIGFFWNSGGGLVDELGQRGGVCDDDLDRVVRRAIVARVVLGELGGIVRELALDEDFEPAHGLALVERGVGGY